MGNEPRAPDPAPRHPGSRWMAQLSGLLNGQSQALRGSLQLAPEAILFAFYFLAFEWLRRAILLPLDSYRDPFFLGAFASHLASRPKLLVLGLIGLGLIGWKQRVLRSSSWQQLPHGGSLRVVIAVAAAVLSWPLIASPYNFFADQLHAGNRILLLALALGVVWRPLFVFPLLLVGGVMIWEFNTPWCNYTWEFFGLPLRLLTLFATWFLLTAWHPSWPERSFWLLLICLVLAHYWVPGFAKLRMGWFTGNDISYIIANSYATGWLTDWNAATIAELARRLSSINPILITGAAVVEIGCLVVILTRWRGVIAFFLILVSFHLGIFLMTGICLWQWAVIELVVAIVFWRGRFLQSLPLFGPWQSLFAIAVIATAPLWHRSAPLSWFDGPIKYAYRFDAVDEQGVRRNLPPQFFAPFDRQFSLHALDHLAEGRPLIRSGPKSEHARVIESRTLADLEALEREIGIPGISHDVHRQERVKLTVDFLTTFARNYNRAPHRKEWFRYLTPPRGVVTLPRENDFPVGEPIHRIDVYQVLSFFDGKSYREMRERKVLEVPIPDSP